jgi:carbon-monoxide dehydrogenase small subunit
VRLLQPGHAAHRPAALLDGNPDATDEEIKVAISGQICRCTGYKNIIAAIRWAAEHGEEVTA